MSPTDIVAHSVAHRQPVAALTDVHSLSALPEFLLECHKKGIMGIAGMTVQIQDGNRYVGDLVLLAKGGAGFAALRDLLGEIGHVGLDTKFNPLRGLKLEDVIGGKYSNELKACVALDGFPGSIADYLFKKHANMTPAQQLADASTGISQLKKQFGEGDYLAVVTQLGPSQLADSVDPSHIVKCSMAFAADDAKSKLTMQLFKFYAKDYLSKLGDDAKINAMLKAKFNGASLSEVPMMKPIETLAMAQHLIERCPPPKIYKTQPESLLLQGGKEVGTLQSVVEPCWEVFKKTLPEGEVETYRARLVEEMDVIRHCHFEDYFLNIYKVQQLAQQSDNSLMLRGSAVSSLVMHVIGMSPIDPIKTGLLFARFLNRDRVEDPDVDIEFESPASIIRELESSFKSGQVALLSSDNGIAKASSLLELAKQALDDFYDLSPQQKGSLDAAYHELMTPLTDPANKRLKWAGRLDNWIEGYWSQLPADKKTKPMQMLVGVAKIYANASFSNAVSPGSVVFIPDGVRRYFNVLQAHRDKIVDGAIGRIPQTKYNLLATGHIKYDLLSNRSFTRAMNAWKMLGLPEEAKLNLNDPSIGLVFSNRAFVGVNQVSGFVGAALAEKFKPKNFAELTALNALIRDGGSPATKHMIEQYIYFKDNPEKVQLPEPLIPILGETHGSLLYEEQLMKLLTDVGGFEWSEADRFRSSLKKGKSYIIDEFEQPFIKQVVAKYGVDENVASAWYQPLRDKRGRFVFNKAHAVAYAHVAVRQCWLKVHYPANYAAELLMDEGVAYKGDNIKLSDIFNDWKKLYKAPDASPQNAKDFIGIVGSILTREEVKPDSLYRRNLGTIQGELLDGINRGVMDHFNGGKENREELLQHVNNMFSALVDMGYQPVVHGKVNVPQATDVDGAPKVSKRADGKLAAGSLVQAATEGNQRVVTTLAVVGEDGNVILPANRRKGFIEWTDGVTIGYFLDFLHRERVIGSLDVQRKAAAIDHYIFTITDKQGILHNYRIGAVTSDPSRSSQRSAKFKLSSGMHQGGSRNGKPTNVLSLASEIINLTGLGGMGPYDLESKNSENKDYKRLMKDLSRYVRNAKEPLYDAMSGGLLSGQRSFAQPSPPLNTKLFSGQRAKAEAKFKTLIQDSRHVNIAGLKEQLDSGDLVLAETHSFKQKNEGIGYRRSLEVVANYRKVSSKEPLYNVPTMKDDILSEGGHQFFLTDHKKGRTSKLDMALTTRRLKAHTHGRIIPGSQTLWMVEAALDCWSFNELQREIKLCNTQTGGNLPFAEENCVSVRSANGLRWTLEYMLSVNIEHDDATDKVDFCMVKRNHSVTPFTDLVKDALKASMQGKTIHWLFDESAANVADLERLRCLLSNIGMTDNDMQQHLVIHPSDAKKTPGQNINAVYDKNIKGSNDLFLHHSNFETWLRSSDMTVEKGPTGAWDVGAPVESVENGRMFSKMSPQEQQQLRNHLCSRFEYLTGAKSMGFGLDMDPAGMSSVKISHAFCKLIGLPTATLMPPNLAPVEYVIAGKPEKVELKDHNDYLMLLRRLQADGQGAAAQALLEKYASYLEPPNMGEDYIPKDKVAVPYKPR